MVVPGGGAVSYEQGTPVGLCRLHEGSGLAAASWRFEWRYIWCRFCPLLGLGLTHHGGLQDEFENLARQSADVALTVLIVANWR